MRGSKLIVMLVFATVAGSASAGGVVRIHGSGWEQSGCPNGTREEAEQCDDGNGDDLDGCTSQCRVAVACNAQSRPGGDRFAVDAATGRCYVIHENELLTFSQATSACASQGGHLASLAHAAEALVLLPLLQAGQRPWIGATDHADEGNFSWLTGETYGHQAFAPGEPDGDGDCVVIQDTTGAWADTHCDLTVYATGYICEHEP